MISPVTVFKKLFTPRQKPLYYVVEEAEWSIRWDGRYITQEVNRQFGLTATVRERFDTLRNSITHFGSRNMYLTTEAYKSLHKSNVAIFTWFHGTLEDEGLLATLPAGVARAERVHTSCQISKEFLISQGVDMKKLVVIPLGVDLELFTTTTRDKKSQVRKALGIPEEVFLVGSFQKDGNGWGKGLEPKPIKGPDVFCDVVEKLHHQHPVYVLLTGPARGYVKSRLAEKKIPFKHVYLPNYQDIAHYYQLLDMYLITSRAEGGPKAVLESMASGVPLVTTRVGMAHDMVEHQVNGLVAEVDDVTSLVQHTQRIIEDTSLSAQLVSNGLDTVQKYAWSTIAQQYYDQLYAPFLR